MNKETEQYIEHEVKIRVLQEKNSAIYKKFDSIDRTFESIERRFESIDRKFDSIDNKFDVVRNEMKSQFHWVLGSISVLYVSLVGTLITALAKSLSWF